MQRLTLQRCFLEHVPTDGILYLLGSDQWHRRVVLLPWVYSNTESTFKQSLYCFGAFVDAPMLTDCINLSRFNSGFFCLYLTDLSTCTHENPIPYVPLSAQKAFWLKSMLPTCGSSCEMRLVQINNKAALSELFPEVSNSRAWKQESARQYRVILPRGGFP